MIIAPAFLSSWLGGGLSRDFPRADTHLLLDWDSYSAKAIPLLLGPQLMAGGERTGAYWSYLAKARSVPRAGSSVSYRGT